jgi:hypothetical protein
MVYAAIDTAEAARIFLSKDAQTTLRRSSGLEREQYHFILSRLANPIQRRQHMHRLHTSDLLYWKPGGTRERAGYFLDGDKIHVCDLTPHEYSGRKRADFPPSEFVSYYPGASDTAWTDEDLTASWARRLDTAAAQLAVEKQDRQAAEALLDEANRERDESMRESAEARAVYDRVVSDLEHHRSALAAAKARIERLERPWWQRFLGRR